MIGNFADKSSLSSLQKESIKFKFLSYKLQIVSGASSKENCVHYLDISLLQTYGASVLY